MIACSIRVAAQDLPQPVVPRIAKCLPSSSLFMTWTGTWRSWCNVPILAVCLFGVA